MLVFEKKYIVKPEEITPGFFCLQQFLTIKRFYIFTSGDSC